MPIDTTCPGCGRKLRVASEHAGKSARCPLCNTIYTVADASETAEAGPEGGERWHLKTPEGQTYGPVARKVLDEWLAEGRISDECRLLREADGVWQDAVAVYPALRPVPQVVASLPAFDNPVAGTPALPNSTAGSLGGVRVVNAHRGALVLALGILSWAIGCPIFGIMAWIMGSSDLREMELGTMDKGGAGMTQAGQIIGMIHAILSLIGLVIFLVVALLLGIFA